MPPTTGYFHAHYGNWSTVELPTRQMLRVAMTDGQIAPHEQESGFVYFQRVADDERNVSLRVELKEAASSSTVTRLDFPFVVDG
jgi:hypothetical protein